MKKIIRVIFAIVCLGLIPFYLKGFFDLVVYCLGNLGTDNITAFCAGLGLGLAAGVLSIFLSRQRNSLWLVFEHELTHLAVGKLCGKKILEMHIGMNNGHVRLSSTNMLISLSPYCFPLLAYLGLLLIQVIRSDLYTTGIAVVGFFLGQHFLTSKQQIHTGQTDLTRYGFFFSLVYIVFFSLLFYGFLTAVVSRELSAGTEFLYSGLKVVLAYAGMF
jgi:hypothetical protein